jgi:hypothetical protein
MHPLSHRIQAAALPTSLTQGAHAAFVDFVDAARTPLSAVVVAAGIQDA